jgi:hypothetical protein
MEETNARINGVADAVEEKVEGVREEVAGVRTEVAEMGKRIEQIEKHKGKPFKQADIEQAIRVCAAYHHNRCTCCERTPIVADGKRLPAFEMDHYNGKHNNKPCDGWPVCGDCNSDLDKQRRFKLEHALQFANYQRHREMLEEDESNPLFRKASNS